MDFPKHYRNKTESQALSASTSDTKGIYFATNESTGKGCIVMQGKRFS